MESQHIAVVLVFGGILLFLAFCIWTIAEMKQSDEMPIEEPPAIPPAQKK